MILKCRTRISSSASRGNYLEMQIIGPHPPSLLKQELWRWGPSNLRLTSPLGGSNVLSLTEKREYKFSKGALKSSPVKTWRGRRAEQEVQFLPRWGGVSPRPRDLSATPFRTHAPRGPGGGAGGVVGTQTKFLAVVTSFELQDQPCAPVCA